LLYFHAARTSFCILHPPIPSPCYSSSPSSPPPPYLYSSFRTVGSVSLTSPYTFSGFSSVRSGISSFSFFIPIPPVIKKTPAAWQIPLLLQIILFQQFVLLFPFLSAELIFINLKRRISETGHGIEHHHKGVYRLLCEPVELIAQYPQKC